MKTDVEAAFVAALACVTISAFLVVAPGRAAAASEPWLEIKGATPGTTVITDAGEKAGRRVAWQLAQFDRAIQKRFPWIKLDDETPLIVFASADEAMVRSMAPDTTDAEKDNAFSSYLIAQTRHVGAVRTDLPETADRDRSPFRGFYRGRATALIDRALGKSAPEWLSRGLTTFLADTVVKDKEILAGRLTLAEVESTPPPVPPAADFFRESRMTDRRFDLQAGLFIQYLLVESGGKNAPALDPWLQKLAASESAASPFTPAGEDNRPVDRSLLPSAAQAPSLQSALARITALYAGFPKHLASKKFSPLKLPIEPSVTAAGFSVRPLPLAEALMLRAEVLFDLNRPVDTRGVLRLAREADPKLARPFEIEAILYEREQRSNEARQAIEAAIQMGSKNASLYYRLGQLLWSRTMAKPALLSVQKLLETARDLSPGDAGAPSYLAEVQSDLALTGPALENAQRGAAGAPTDVYAQMALARARWNARQTDPAIAVAQKALAFANVASQKHRVQEFLTFATKNKRAQAAGTKPWTSQFGPPPSGAFGATRSAIGGTRVGVGTARTDSGDASAITDCFANRNDAACSRAVPSLEATCAEKEATACVSLGSLYEGGFGVARDRRKAASIYKTACGLGDKPGCARLAVLEAQGLSGAKATTPARKALGSLCGEQIPEACIGLAQILRQTGFAADRTRAASLLKSACDAGSADACALVTSR